MILDKKKFNLVLARAEMNKLDLAQKSGISPSTICKAVNKNSCLRTATIGRIAKALGVDPSEIIEEETNIG